jgi:hypothetical protein
MDVDKIDNTSLSSELFCFLEAIREDSRISPVHISLFIAIMQQCNKNNWQNPICILPRELMELSKISGRATYYKALKELHEYGYVRYKPSHDCLTGSFIYLTGCDKT